MKHRPPFRTGRRHGSSFSSRIWYRPAVVDPQRRRRRRMLLLKTLWFLWLGGGGIYLFWIGYEGLAHSSLFEVRRVEITGLQRLSHGDLAPLIGVDPSMRLFEVDLEALKGRLLTHPWIKEVQIRKTYPDTLAVRVFERLPIAVVEEDFRKILVDDTGRALGEAGESAWPVLQGIDLAALREGDPDQQAAFLKAMTLLSLMEQGRTVPTPHGTPDSITIDVGYPKEAVLEQDGYRIRFGEEDFREKWERYRLVESDMAKRKGHIKEVDLRFPGQVIVR